ncbi:hypothetical protein IZ6_07810 [Terrihabitans soli]|uniref:F5/8 type C domain-containing protein n=1 Tax=Terrihabitans soli TaxID=708113 RepID=A0A6S6QL71_9HYPH|nr:hypothetical protein [Terrihabitans soli]BCJ90046.1 hypothetical protein IZ6_07810 [Terrihabitans soli]
MIVLSQALLLSLAGSPNANDPLIGWHNLVVFGGIVADHEDTLYPASNLSNPSTSIKQSWKSDSTSDQYVTFDISSDHEVDYVGIAGHNAGTGRIEITIEYPDTENPGEWLVLVEPFMPDTDAPLLLRFVGKFLEQIRIKLSPQSVAPRIAVVHVGALLVVHSRLYVDHKPITLAPDVTVQTNWSQGGDYLGSVLLNEKRSTAFGFKNLDPAWVRSTLKPFVAVSKKRPWFWSWRPAAYPLEVGYVIALNDPQPVNQLPNGAMMIDFQVGGTAP